MRSIYLPAIVTLTLLCATQALADATATTVVPTAQSPLPNSSNNQPLVENNNSALLQKDSSDLAQDSSDDDDPTETEVDDDIAEPNATCIAGENCPELLPPPQPAPTCISGVNCPEWPPRPAPTCISGVNCPEWPPRPAPTCISGVNCPEWPPRPPRPPPPRPPPPPPRPPPPPPAERCSGNIVIEEPDDIRSNSAFDVDWRVPSRLAQRDFRYTVELWRNSRPRDELISTLGVAFNNGQFTDDGINFNLRARVGRIDSRGRYYIKIVGEPRRADFPQREAYCGTRNVNVG